MSTEALPRPRLVVCDDSATMRATIPALLGSAYEFLLLTSGEEVLASAAAFGPDLVISDLMMEGMDGYELCQRVKAEPAFRNVPVILLTSKTDDSSRATGLEVGADDYLFKPIRARELKARVASLVNLRRATQALEHSRRETQAILDNIQQAIFTVGADLRINPELSRFVSTVFGEVPFAGQTLSTVLAAGEGNEEARRRLDDWLRIAFAQPHLDWEMVSQLVDRRFSYRRTDGTVRELVLEFRPIREGGGIHRLMVVAEDITEKLALQRDLERKTRENEDDIDQISELIQVDPDVFERFLVEADDALAGSRRALAELREAERPQEVVARLFRGMHTLKGNARSFRLNLIATKAHWVEDTFAELREAPVISEQILAETQQRISDLEVLLARARALADRVLKPHRDLGVARSADRPVTVLVSLHQVNELRSAVLALAKGFDAHVFEQLQRAVNRIGLVPMSKLFDRFPKMVRDLAAELGKQIHELRFEGAETTLADARIVHLLGSPLVHIVRNALDHGLEAPAVRTARGKPPGGRLAVAAGTTDEALWVEVWDDGKGIDVAELTRKAVEKGLVTPARAAGLSAVEAMDLIFLPGLSTADKVTEISGRGVGMDVVRSSIESLGGTVIVESKPGEETRIRLEIPRSIAEKTPPG